MLVTCALDVLLLRSVYKLLSLRRVIEDGLISAVDTSLAFGSWSFLLWGFNFLLFLEHWQFAFVESLGFVARCFLCLYLLCTVVLFGILFLSLLIGMRSGDL